MTEIKVKPITNNLAWRGKRYKTKLYQDFEKEFWYLLPDNVEVGKEKLKIYFEFGLSNKNADYDNCIKQTQDVISKKYGFNDKQIYEAHIKKVDVKKGEEYIKFEINPYAKNNI